MSPVHEHVFSIHIEAPIEDVFREITRTGEVQRSFFDTVLDSDLRPGKPLRYRTRDGKRTFIAGEVLEVAPPARFVHTFRFSHLDDAPTRVTYALAPEGKGVRVTVTHDRFEGATRTFKMIGKGWPFILANLKSLFERGRLPLKTRVQYAVMKVMMPLMPKGGAEDPAAKCAALA